MAMRTPWPFSATMRHSTSATLPSGRATGIVPSQRPPSPERRVQLPADLLVARRDDVDAALADDVVALAAGEAAELRVHVAEHQVRIEQRDAARGQFEDRAEARVGGALEHVGLAREQQRAHRGDQHRRIHRVREVAVAAGRQSLQHVVVATKVAVRWTMGR